MYFLAHDLAKTNLHTPSRVLTLHTRVGEGYKGL